jgi:hypothetical protein
LGKVKKNGWIQAHLILGAKMKRDIFKDVDKVCAHIHVVGIYVQIRKNNV